MLHFSAEHARYIRDRTNRHPEGWDVFYNRNKHYVFFPRVGAQDGDKVFFYLPEYAKKSVGDTVTIDGIVYYVAATYDLQLGDKDPLIRIALLSVYAPPCIPQIFGARWEAQFSGITSFYISCENDYYLKHFEIWMSFDLVNWFYYSKTGPGKFVIEDMPPLEHVFVKARSLDTFNRYSDFSRVIHFEAQWKRWEGNPIYDPSYEGAWASLGTMAPDLAFESGQMHLFFTGFDNNINYRVGHATMPISDWELGNYANWTADPANPVIGASGVGYMSGGAGESELLRIGSLWWHFYTGFQLVGLNFIGQGIGTAWAVNLNGPWNIISNTTPRIALGAPGSWDDFDVFGCGGFYEDGKTHIWYSGGPDNTNPWKFGYAVGDDPYSLFAKPSPLPVLEGTGVPGDWDQHGVYYPPVRKWGNFLIYYFNGVNSQVGSGTDITQIGTAWSGGPTSTVYRTPNNPDFHAWIGNETSLTTGLDIYREPGTWKYFMLYSSTDNTVTPSVFQINLARLFPEGVS